MEKDLEIRDRFKLFAWGLTFKEALLRRKYFLEAVNELKRKLRKVLYVWQDKKAEENFKGLVSLIENYDKDDPYYKKQKLGGKLTKKKFTSLKVTKEPILQTVDEREEEDLKPEDEESFFNDPGAGLAKRLYNKVKQEDVEVQDITQNHEDEEYKESNEDFERQDEEDLPLDPEEEKLFLML